MNQVEGKGVGLVSEVQGNSEVWGSLCKNNNRSMWMFFLVFFQLHSYSMRK